MEAENKSKKIEYATFAGGCFWCMEPVFRGVDGILNVTAGYSGGSSDNPAYEKVALGVTGHLEAIQIVFDPLKIPYKILLNTYWHQIDPTDPNGQFADRGPQYRTAIFYHNEKQKKEAERSLKELERSKKYDKPIATLILPYKNFYPAEAYHQKYYLKNPEQYEAYKIGSGREAYVEKQADKSDKDLLERTCGCPEKNMAAGHGTTQSCQTEPPFKNAYWDNKREGIYADAVSGEPLFSSFDKFDSGTGWPSFTKPIIASAVSEREDKTHNMERIEVRSKKGDAHLGHKFYDGPKPAGTRYCVNSASLKFIAKEDLEKEGYGEYLKLFQKRK